MPEQTTIEELLRKLQQQEDTVAQLVRIIASTNHRIAELEIKMEDILHVSTK